MVKQKYISVLKINNTVVQKQTTLTVLNIDTQHIFLKLLALLCQNDMIADIFQWKIKII